MAAGDVKGKNVVVIRVQLASGVTKGQIIALDYQNDEWNVASVDQTGRKAVALGSGDYPVVISAVIFGLVEVMADPDNDILAGDLVGVSSDGEVSRNINPGVAFATAMEHIKKSSPGTIWVGLV